MSPVVYRVLHDATFVLHAAGAAFVHVGTLLLVLFGLAALLRSPAADSWPARLAATLRDLLPFVLGLTITFGVAPLLFVQLLSPHAFYSAAILLSHRFMAILPALIVGFYLLYVQKTDWRLATSKPGRVLLPMVASACFAFTATSWSELHLLAQRAADWPEVYREGPLSVQAAAVWPRMAVFTGLGCVVVPVLAGFGLRARGEDPLPRFLPTLAIVGVSSWALGLLLHPTAGSAPSSALELSAAVAAGLVLGAAAWCLRARPGTRSIAVLAAVGALWIERTVALRTWYQSAVTNQSSPDVQGASSQGFSVFVVAGVFVILAIAWALRRIVRDLRQSAAS